MFVEEFFTCSTNAFAGSAGDMTTLRIISAFVIPLITILA